MLKETISMRRKLGKIKEDYTLKKRKIFDITNPTTQKYLTHWLSNAKVINGLQCYHGNKVTINNGCHHQLLSSQESCAPDMKLACLQTASRG